MIPVTVFYFYPNNVGKMLLTSVLTSPETTTVPCFPREDEHIHDLLKMLLNLYLPLAGKVPIHYFRSLFLFRCTMATMSGQPAKITDERPTE